MYGGEVPAAGGGWAVGVSGRGARVQAAAGPHAFPRGADAGNYRIREIAEIVARTFPGCELTIGESGGDTRSYRVSFAKIRKHLPKFETAWDAERGARQLKATFDRIGLTHRSGDQRTLLDTKRRA